MAGVCRNDLCDSNYVPESEPESGRDRGRNKKRERQKKPRGDKMILKSCGQ